MTNPTICCIGDSLTEGTYSVDWVTNLSKKLPSINFINKGNNGETAAAVRSRIQTDVIDLKPEFVVLLIGGNDIIGATNTEAGKMYVKMFPEIQKEPPTYKQYETEMETIIKKLDKDLPKDSQILVLSPPPIGEGGMDSPEWNLGAKFSLLCEEIVLGCSDRVLSDSLSSKTECSRDKATVANLHVQVRAHRPSTHLHFGRVTSSAARSASWPSSHLCRSALKRGWMAP